MRGLVALQLGAMVVAAAACSSTTNDGTSGAGAGGSGTTSSGANGGGVTPSSTATGGTAAGGAGGSFSGTWALELVMTTLTDTGISTVEAPNTTIARVAQIQEGSSLTITATTCDLAFGDGSGGISIIVPDAFVAAMPVEVIDAEVTSSSLHVPTFWEVRSVELATPESDPLPTDPDDPRVLDWDEDGHPGLTLTVASSIPGLSGDVYLIQRNWIELTSTSATTDRIDGTVAWGMDQVILDATSSALEYLPGGEATTDPAKNYFVHRRIDPTMTCEGILAEKDTLFG